MRDKPEFALVGNSHMTLWTLNIYSPQWGCLNHGAPEEGLAYVESFHEDTSDCQVMIQFRSNDTYQLNEENTGGYVERCMKAALAVPKVRTYLLCIFPCNDHNNHSTIVDKLIRMLNEKIVVKLTGTGVVYLDVFDQLLKNSRLNPELIIDDLCLSEKGYRISGTALKQAFSGQEHL